MSYKLRNMTKREYFLYITNKRIIRAVAMINSFKNFYSKHNKRHYEFSEKDMLKLDIKLTSALEEWRESYQEHFNYSYSQMVLKEKEIKLAIGYAKQLSKKLKVNKTEVILDWLLENRNNEERENERIRILERKEINNESK